jgi:hypothetical protein
MNPRLIEESRVTKFPRPEIVLIEVAALSKPGSVAGPSDFSVFLLKLGYVLLLAFTQVVCNLIYRKKDDQGVRIVCGCSVAKVGTSGKQSLSGLHQ